MTLSTFVIQTIKATYISLKDLRYIYMTAILSTFLIKSKKVFTLHIFTRSFHVPKIKSQKLNVG